MDRSPRHYQGWMALPDGVALEIGDVTVVRFVDRKILDAANIQELGEELFEVGEHARRLLDERLHRRPLPQ